MKSIAREGVMMIGALFAGVFWLITALFALLFLAVVKLVFGALAMMAALIIGIVWWIAGWLDRCLASS